MLGGFRSFFKFCCCWKKSAFLKHPSGHWPCLIQKGAFFSFVYCSLCVDYHSRNGTSVSQHWQGKKGQREECHLWMLDLFSKTLCQSWERVSNRCLAAGSSCRPWLRDSSLFFLGFPHFPLPIFVFGHKKEQPVRGQTRGAPCHLFSRLPVCWVQLHGEERAGPGKGWIPQSYILVAHTLPWFKQFLEHWAILIGNKAGTKSKTKLRVIGVKLCREGGHLIHSLCGVFAGRTFMRPFTKWQIIAHRPGFEVIFWEKCTHRVSSWRSIWFTWSPRGNLEESSYF